MQRNRYRFSNPGKRQSAQLFGRLLRIGLLSGAVLTSQLQSVWPQARAQGTPGEHTSADAQLFFQEAERHLRQGDTEKAIAAAREGLKNAPQDVAGWNLLGLAYTQQQDLTQAVAAFERALAIAPHSARTHINLGNTYFAMGKLDRSENEFRAALRDKPQDRDAAYNLGMVLLARGDAQHAIPVLQQIRPPDVSTQIALVQAYFQARRREEALARALAVSKQAKNDVRPHVSLGILLAREREYDAAIHELELADSLSPRTPEILHNLGQAYYRTKRYDKAEEVLKRALSLSPNSPDTLYVLAQVYAAEQKDVQALELLTRARQLAPENTDIIFLIGRLSMMQAYYEDAIRILEEGVKLDPRRPDLRAALGESYFSAGKVPKATEEFEKLIEIDPSASSYAFMGLCYRHLNRFDDARKYFEEGLKKDPRNGVCLYNLGFIESKQGNYPQAEKLLEESLRSSPDYSDAYYELGKVKIAERKYDEAIPLLRKCAALATKKAQVYYNLSNAERHTHQDAAAVRDMKVFQTLSKDEANAPYPFQHFLEALDQRASLPPRQKAEIDLQELLRMDARNPNDPRTLYLLVETYLKLGRVAEARQRASQLDEASGRDVRTELGAGTLLARYGLFSDALQHYQAALQADPASDDAKYNLANAYFQLRDYGHALDAVLLCSREGQEDGATLSLLGDIYSHLGRTSEAANAFEKAIAKNPDNDQGYLSLALAELRAGNTAAAGQALQRGLQQAPNSGQILWGLGVLAVLEGATDRAESYLRRALDLMPEWHGSYETLEMLYVQTGQGEKAQDTLELEAPISPDKGRVPVGPAESQKSHVLSAEARREFLQKALTLADEME
jgi:tetratricopeptide (TPR) repeat protein